MSDLDEKKDIPKLKNYEVIREIGRGGMAVVYKAIQKSLRRVVAIKELNLSSQSDTTVIRRFEREAVTTSSLSHENIVSIHDFFAQGKKRYLVMEYVGGTDLAAVMEYNRPVPIQIATLIVLQLVRALEYAHALGLVHRDIKPGNVMMSNEGLVKLTDFGVVQTPNSDGLTMPGTFIGTPRYMSPEQIMGGLIDFRSDIFSIGILFYELVTGEPLFDGFDSTNIFYKVTRMPVRRPSRIRAGLPPRLAGLILRCLRRDPRKRFRTTQQLRRALEDFLGDQVLLTARPRIAAYLARENLVIPEGQELPSTMGPSLSSRGWRPFFYEQEWRGFHRTFATVVLGLLFLGHSLWVQARPPNPLVDEQYARLRVTANPWAKVYVDHRLREVTPFSEAITVTPGFHRVTVAHPDLAAHTFKIEFRPGDEKRLPVDLELMARRRNE